MITTHRGPDGDAMGSSLALYNILVNLGHKVTVITPNDYASFLHWMPGNDKVIEYDGNESLANEITNSAELVIMLDFNSKNRLDNYADTVFSSDTCKVLIDHHQDPDMKIADLIFSDPDSCSTAQLLYEVLDLMNFTENIDQNIAECLYTGIMTDTGSFKYNSTTSKTHNIIAKLIDKGARSSMIHDLVYDNSSADKMKLLGYCINNLLCALSTKTIKAITATDINNKNTI